MAYQTPKKKLSGKRHMTRQRNPYMKLWWACPAVKFLSRQWPIQREIGRMNGDFGFRKPQRLKWNFDVIMDRESIRWKWAHVPPAQTICELIWRTRNMCSIQLCKTNRTEKTQSLQENALWIWCSEQLIHSRFRTCVVAPRRNSDIKSTGWPHSRCHK